jgi:hypothetical protein
VLLVHRIRYRNNNEIRGACSTYGKEERCIEGLGGET